MGHGAWLGHGTGRCSFYFSHEVRMLSNVSWKAGLQAMGLWVWLVAWGGVLFDFQSHIIMANIRRCFS